MKKTVRLMALVMVLVMLCAALSACGKKLDSKVVGTWEYNEGSLGAIYVLNADGTGTYTIKAGTETSKQNITYKTEGGKLLITFEGDTDVFEMPYSFSGADMIVKDTFGTEMTFKKQ